MTSARDGADVRVRTTSHLAHSVGATVGPRVADELLHLVPNVEVYRKALCAIKLWAQRTSVQKTGERSQETTVAACSSFRACVVSA